MEAVLLLGVLLIVGGTVFLLGYQAARRANRRFENKIQRAYQQLLTEQREQANSPASLARKRGFNEGYQQGIEDAHQAIDQMTGQP